MTTFGKEERKMFNFLDASVGLKGARDSDEFSINIFGENKKTYRLNRFKYSILKGNKFNFDFVKSEITLPYYEVNDCAFELLLVNKAKAVTNNAESRYLLRSMKNTPFRLNGAWCFEAYIERGDQVDIGYNRLSFRKPFMEEKKSDSLLKIPQEIIESNLGIVIEGETGTGKTTLAKKIHEESGVAGEFVHLNLASFAPSLIESELFGHVKGAFTGAQANKRGAFVQANRGTLFLDEIDSLPKEMQTKLLLFLDNFEVRAVGGEHGQKVQVRMLFASGRDLKTLVAEKFMRADFYYRLMSGYNLKLPSMLEDQAIVRRFCEQFASQEYVVISDELICFYEGIYWPGNIRQLKSHLLKKKIMSSGKKIVFDQTDESLLTYNSSISAKADYLKLEEIKYEHSLKTYLKLQKNLKQTAKTLGVSQNTLRGILKRNSYLGSEHKF